MSLALLASDRFAHEFGNPRRRPIHPTIDEEMAKQPVRAFYTHMRAAPEVGTIFSRAIGTHREIHLGKMRDFWSSVMLMPGPHKRNPVLAHMYLKMMRRGPLGRWFKLFRKVVYEICPPDTGELFIARGRISRAAFSLACSSTQTILRGRLHGCVP